MVLVFLCGLCILIILFILLLLLSTIKINIEKLYISNIDNDIKKDRGWKKEFVFYLELYLFNKIRLIRINLNEKKLKKLNIDKKIKQLDKFEFDKKDILNKENLLLLKKLHVNLAKFHLNIKIGTEDAILTSISVAVISALLGIVLGNVIKEYDSELHFFKIDPIYINTNVIKIDLKSILNINMVHIIHVIYMLLKKRRVYKNERTSNRRSYDYSYE